MSYMSYKEWKQDMVKKDNTKVQISDMNNVTVVVGRQGYRASDVDYIQTPKEFPRMQISVDLSPFNRTAFRQLVGVRQNPFAIKKVHFNPPATVVLWEDGTKTVVKTQNGEEYDAEKGLAMAIAKKALGNKGSYFNEIKKHTEPFYEDVEKIKRSVDTLPPFSGSDFLRLLFSGIKMRIDSDGAESD